MTPRRRADYAKLDEIGFDVVEAILSKEGSSAEALARENGVSAFNLALWRRFRRTELYCQELDPETLLDELAGGETLASIARREDLSYQILNRWVAKNIPHEDIEAVRELTADSQFERTKGELKDAKDDFDLKRTMATHGIERFQAERTTRRYTDERQLRIQAPSGVIFSVNTGHLDPQIANPPPEEKDK